MHSKDSMVEPQRKEHEHFELRAIHVINVFPVRYKIVLTGRNMYTHTCLIRGLSVHLLTYLSSGTSLKHPMRLVKLHLCMLVGAD